MQQLQKLELTGFKSFCDRTQIIFNEGITSIVGPNGCGKSNISDAISWVVGEQSAKSLRTDRMEGVIFNGTQARKPTGFAEVVLTLRLAANFNPIDGIKVNPESFSVGRRLYRSGESEYYLDGRRCRLKDIQALFEGTGLGPNSYAIIEQGRIGQILSSKPADRRALIEEAARVTLFKSRRYSAEMKLELAQQNLVRVHDIIREVVRQLNSLRRQAAKARRYGRLREEFRLLQRLKFGMEDRQLRAALEECALRFAAAQESEHSVLSELSLAEETRGSIQQLCRDRETGVNEVRERLSMLRVESGNAQNTLESQETQRLGLIARSKELERESQTIAERALLITREQERLSDAFAVLSAELVQEQESLLAEQSRSERVQVAIRTTEGEIDRLRADLVAGAGNISDLKGLQNRCNENIQRISGQIQRLESEGEKRRQEGERLSKVRDDARQAYDEKLGRQKEVSGLLEERERSLAGLVESVGQLSSELTARQEEHSLLQHRLSSLEEIERRRTNYSEGVQKYLSAQVPGEGDFTAQTLADNIETDPAFETAIEDYLNGPLQYILVEGLPQAVRSVDRVRRVAAGKCTFLTIQNGHGPHDDKARPPVSGDGVIGYLGNLVRMKEDVKQAFERALPEYASTIMVQDLDTAFRVSESHPYSTYLTMTGESYSPRGTLSAVGERKSMAGFLALKREKRELKSKLNALRMKIDSARESLAQLKEEQGAAAEAVKGLGAEARKLELDIVVAGHEVSRLEDEIQKLERQDGFLKSELAQLSTERGDFQAKLAQAAEKMVEIEERSRSGHDRFRELAEKLESLRQESSAASKGLAALLSSHAVKQERKSAAEADMRRLSAEGQDVERRRVNNETERTRAAQRKAELEEAQECAKARIEECAQLLRDTERSLSEKQQELAIQRESLSEIDGRLRVLHSQREETMSTRSKIEIEKTRLESDSEHLQRNCQDEFHIPLADFIAEIDEVDWRREYADVLKEHDEARSRIEAYGPINMRALEEYQELDERYQFLNSQRLDIEQSIADTQKAIAEINRRSLEQFQDAFKAIRENFAEVFQILFKGGQCDLRLLDDEDVLESGIDIIAQPPGKRLQNVLLLSGGEKALTALALLIAIFRYRPSPFCVMDEVDAPLDDANVDRFTRLVSELSKDTQFVIITHNKKTMETAQTLYGVTMEEPGVSKIIGVDFRHTERAVAV